MLDLNDLKDKKIYVGVTDNNWFNFLKDNKCIVANFWRTNTRNFACLKKGDIFLFKLHRPFDNIVGGGIFDHYEVNSIPVAWNRYGKSNGVPTIADLEIKLGNIKEKFNNEDNPEIGCIIIKDLFFFDKPIEKPSDFDICIVSGKTYDNKNIETNKLRNKIIKALSK